MDLSVVEHRFSSSNTDIIVFFFFFYFPSDAAQVKESMDLYEEIVTEERQSRDSTYSEVNKTHSFCWGFVCLSMIEVSHLSQNCLVC